ncbi:MAG: class IV adenylate cyclase [Patescibacteria group bacterium]|nr:class IV adenylate cyclase [Patescibacteria group bacterium]
MREIELKFKVKNFKNIVPKLKKLGAKLLWQGIEENYYFDTPNADLKKKSVYLRIRKWPGHSNSLTLKVSPLHKTKKYKILREYQVSVSDLKTTRIILENLGFVEKWHYKKYRKHWKLGGVVIELDWVKNHRIVEIEGSKKKINELAKKLGLDFKDSTTKGYLNILNLV